MLDIGLVIICLVTSYYGWRVGAFFSFVFLLFIVLHFTTVVIGAGETYTTPQIGLSVRWKGSNSRVYPLDIRAR